MRRSMLAAFLLCVLFAVSLIGCTELPAPLETPLETPSNDDRSAQLNAVLQDYERIVNGELPEDIRLTIYCMEANLATRIPLSVEDVIRLHKYKTVVDAEKLIANQTALQKLSSAKLHPLQGDYYLNARVYYVFDIGETGKILEVAMWCYDDGPGYGYGVFVNGIAVRECPVLFELIEPFLTEEIRDMLERETKGQWDDYLKCRDKGTVCGGQGDSSVVPSGEAQNRP